MDIIHDYHEAYDIVNETFLTVMMHYGWWIKLGEAGKLKYINSCCLRLCNRYILRNSKIYSVEFLDEQFEHIEWGSCETDEIIERETLRKCMMSIGLPERRIIRQYYELGLKADEIAHMENVSKDCIIKRLSRSRRCLKKYYRQS